MGTEQWIKPTELKSRTQKNDDDDDSVVSDNKPHRK